jgi:DNA-binding MarR family transcriptional regulator
VDDAEAIDLWGSIIRAVGLTNRQMHAGLREEFDLSEAEVDTLVVLGGTPQHRATMAALASSAAFTSGGYTKIADRLEHRGLIRRTPGTEDRRVTFLDLTEHGAVVAGAVRDRIAAFVGRAVIGRLGADDTRRVASAIDALRVAAAED